MRPTRVSSVASLNATPSPPYLASRTPVRYPLALACRRLPPFALRHLQLRGPLRKPPYRVGRAIASQRPAPGHRRDPPPAHRRHLASTCGPGRATRRPRTNGLSHFVEHMLFRGSARYPELVRAEPGDRGARRHALRRDRARLLALPDPAAADRAAARPGDPRRALQHARPSATSSSSARSSSRRSSRTWTTTGATSTSTTCRALAAWDGHPLGYTDHRAAAQRAALHDRRRARATSSASTAPPTWCCAWPGRSSTGACERRRARRSRACRAARATQRRRRRARHRRPALPRDPQRVGADPGADPVSRRARERPRLPGAARAARACSTTGCRRGCTTRSAIRRGSPTRSSGNLLLVPRQRAHRDRRRLRAREAAGPGRRGAVDPGALPRRAGQRGGARQGQAPLPRRPRGLLRRSRQPVRLVRRHRALTRARARRNSARASWMRVRPEDIRRAARRVIRAERLCVVVVGALDRARRAQGLDDRARVPLSARGARALLRLLVLALPSSSPGLAAAGGARGVTSMASASVSFTGLHALSWHITNLRLGVDRLRPAAASAARYGDVEARGVLGALGQVGAGQLGLGDGQAGVGRLQRDGDRRLGVDVPPVLGGDGQAGAGVSADGDLGLGLADLVERVRQRTRSGRRIATGRQRGEGDRKLRVRSSTLDGILVSTGVVAWTGARHAGFISAESAHSAKLDETGW